MSGDTIHPARVFVVCAEGREAFAAALRRRLAIEQPEITFWQDHVELEGGIDWWGQVEKALDWVNFLW